jgi:hypothetical protein
LDRRLGYADNANATDMIGGVSVVVFESRKARPPPPHAARICRHSQRQHIEQIVNAVIVLQ